MLYILYEQFLTKFVPVSTRSYLLIHLLIHLFIHQQSIYLSVYLSIYLSIYLYNYLPFMHLILFFSFNLFIYTTREKEKKMLKEKKIKITKRFLYIYMTWYLRFYIVQRIYSLTITITHLFIFIQN